MSCTIFADVADEEAIEVSLTLRLMVEHKRPISAGLSTAGDEAFTELQSKYLVVSEMVLDPALTRKHLPRKRPARAVG